MAAKNMICLIVLLISASSIFFGTCSGGDGIDWNFTNIRAIEVSSNDGYPYLQMLLIALVSTTDHFKIEGQIQPNIQEIRKLLKRNDFRILNEFTQIV